MNIKNKYIIMKRKIIYRMKPKVAHSILYFLQHKCLMNWKNPVSYDEKIHWLIAYKYHKEYGKYADKYEAREYVRECGLEKLLIPLLGVYEHTEQIDYDKLPDKFVLKTTHASGEEYYCICKGKKNFNITDANQKLEKALKRDFHIEYCQYHYSNIIPRIICEEYLYVDGQDMLTDYKVVCSNGRPLRILVCKERNQGRDYYDLDWNYCDYTKVEYQSGSVEKRPDKLKEMLEAAAILSKPFPLARIDFYIVNNKLYFGEITLTPSAGNHKNLTNKGQAELGSLIQLR